MKDTYQGDTLEEKGVDQEEIKKEECSEVEIEEEQVSADNFKEKYVYALAEIENIKKRFSKEKSNLLKYGQERILGDLLDVLDNFDRTLFALDKVEDANTKNIVFGIQMIKDQFENILTQCGLKEIESLEKTFDPMIHEAVETQEVESEDFDNTIIKELQRGFMLHDRVLRASRVIVGKYSSENKN